MIKEKNDHKVVDAAHLFWLFKSQWSACETWRHTSSAAWVFSTKAGTHVLAVASRTSDWSPCVRAGSRRHRRLDGKEFTFRCKNGATNWVCAYCQDNHGWISEFFFGDSGTDILEVLNHDTDIPCFVQGRMLWFSAPTSLNDDLLNDGVILEHVTKQSTCLSKVHVFCTLDGKNLFHEVNTCSVGRYDRTGVGTQRWK